MDGVRHRPGTASFESLGVAYSAPRTCTSRWVDHRVALLVKQGRDPTLPDLALVLRGSPRLFSGFAPRRREAFAAREPAAAAAYSPDPSAGTAPTPRRANTLGSRSPNGWGPRRRPSWILCSSSRSGRAA